MSLFGGDAVKPSTVAQDALSDMTRERYNRLQSLYTPIENEVLSSLNDPRSVEYDSRDAGRAARDRTRLLQRTAAYDLERRGIDVPAEDQAIIDRRNKYAEKVNTKRAETSGMLASMAARERNLAGVVDAGNSQVSRGLASLQQAAQMEAQENAANAGTRAGMLEKIAGTVSGAISGFAVGGPAGAVAGGGLAASQYF